MNNLTPEQRVNRLGHLVTKHVRTGALPTTVPQLPAPSLSLAKDSMPSLPEGRTKQVRHELQMHYRSPDSRLRTICSRLNTKLYGTAEFTASDVEIYDVLSATHGNNAMLLLAAGLRTREDACAFLTEHHLEFLITDHRKVTQAALARDIPAFYAMDSMGFHGSSKQDEPCFLDALEANGIRALREMDKYYPRIPTRVMNDEISLSDIKIIGASRLAKASRTLPVVEQLKKIHSGKSSYDAHVLKQLIIQSDGRKWEYLSSPVDLANRFGAEMVRNLHHLPGAEGLLSELTSDDFSETQRAEIITYNDELLLFYANLTSRDLIFLYNSGAPAAKDVVKGLDDGLTMHQIAAISEGIQSSLSSGWL